MITVTVTVQQDGIDGEQPTTTVWTHREQSSDDARLHVDATQHAVVRAAGQVVRYLRPHVEWRNGTRVAEAASDLIDSLRSG